jgi:phycobilisome rod-core linker protein
MAIPLLGYTPSSRNHRVATLEVPGDEYPRQFTTNYLTSSAEIDTLIQSAYQQIFHEQQMLEGHRQPTLESQLKSGQISVRDFIERLATSDSFRRLNYEVNNNYRFAQICVQRILGRDLYSDREALAWSVVIATKGYKQFINDLVMSDEYEQNFGDDLVPYQRRRILQQRSLGELPFERTPRYGEDYLAQLQKLGHNFSSSDRRFSIPVRYRGLPPEQLRLIGAGITYGLGGFFLLLGLGVVLSWFGWISL